MNTENTTTTTAANDTHIEMADDNANLEHALTDLVRIGYAWAAHGLNIGKGALEISSRSTDAASRILGDLAGKFETLRDGKSE